MFIGWIRKNSFESDIKMLSEELLIDENLVINTVSENQSLCFGAYEQDKLEAFICAYSFENSILINNFCYKEDFDDELKERIVKILLNNIYEDNKSIVIISSANETDIFKKFGFEEYGSFLKASYNSGGAVFNFSSSMAKSISGENYLGVINNLDKKVFGDNRAEYISKKLSKSSSLFLSTEFGYQHSYALSKSVVKISPWVMADEAFLDAEKLLRGVIYHRGLKNLISFIPEDVSEIVDLYKSYNFEFKGGYKLMYKNKKPDIKLDSIYGF